MNKILKNGVIGVIISTALIMALPYESTTLANTGNKVISKNYGDKSALTSQENKISDNLDKYMEAMNKYKNFHGSVLVAKGGKIFLDKGFGMADYSTKIANTKKTRFAIGSLTKAFTAMGIMQLQEKGLININDKLSKYFKGFTYGEQITIHNLLTHTSGLAALGDDATLKILMENYKKYSTTDNIINFLKNTKPDFKPGTKYEYSNAGYIVLGAIIEKVTKMSYGDYLQKNIFNPLGMKDTGMCYKNGKKLYNSKGYSGFLDLKYINDEPCITIAGAAGGLYSTTEDMYRWDRGIKDGKLVSAKTMNKIFTGYYDAGQGKKYGYGWLVYSEPSGKIETHDGGTLSFSSSIVRYVDKDMTIIILTNSADYNITDLRYTLQAIMLNEKYEMPQKRTFISKPIDSKTIENYVGKYELSEGVYAVVSKNGSDIYIQLTGGASDKIYPETDSKYYFYEQDTDVEFIKDEKTHIINLVFEQGEDKIKAVRISK